ncbi:alpha-L-fucosidase [Asticcacaulis sp. SL142]|uniref:alpha-L-fucosidase n=1 Tax=Asticcacaulis sp. SL142 TaxID=2995155 RepID=UPI00226CCC0F|nr:alpha-L-fucosidase [Asticcacaulis sp. SL142]WAC49450.1 alpha-L-fucosidase [Asticcacaulis sp. SL142]
MTTISKRQLLGAPLLAALGASALSAKAADSCAPTPPAPKFDLPMQSGKFTAEVASLKTYETPAWFRDAKFGIWSHWGPQAVPKVGDWYARQMYIPGHPHYTHHVKTYGHPSKFGFKDIIPLWKAEKFDPEGLMDKYADAGAKYFVSMGVHHDNFDLWNSRHHRWNAVAMGPKRDIVGDWKKAAKKRGLKYGVSEHLAASYTWYQTSHQYDQFWPLLGTPYDGANPENFDLYHPNKGESFVNTPESWYTQNPEFQQVWYNRMKDLVDQYEPDLFYSDGGLPFGQVGRSLVAHLYNRSVTGKGKAEAVYTCKDSGSGEFHKEASVQDVERGVLAGINPYPWQTCTSMGDWFYSEGYKYKTTADIVYMLSDIVSKNGNLLLNVVQLPDGSLPPESEAFLSEMAAWMKINGPAIHGTRPWKIFGEGPTETSGGAFKENAAYVAQDIRFTTRGKTLYAITLGEPRTDVVIKSLGKRANLAERPVRKVQALGSSAALRFQQTDEALVISLPPKLPTAHASAFQITFG